MSTLKTVTVTLTFVMVADPDYKDDFSMARRCFDEAIHDVDFHHCEVDIADYKDGDGGYDDRCTPYGYGHLVQDKTIGEHRKIEKKD